MKLSFLILVLIGSLLVAMTSLADVLPVGAASELKANQVYYNHKYFTFPNWQAGTEKKALNLFPEFRQTSLSADIAEQVKIQDPNKIVIFLGQSRLVVDRPIKDMKLQSLTELATLQKIHDGLATVDTLNPAEIVTHKRKIFAYRNPPKGEWCSDPSSVCLQLSLVFSTVESMLLKGMLCLSDTEKCMKLETDSTLTAQSELKVETPAEGSEDAAQLRKLTGISTPVKMVVTENLFWFNHALEFAKIVMILQPNPNKSSQTVLSTFVVFAFDDKWWSLSLGDAKLNQVILGERFNGTTGLSQGLPKAIQDLTQTVGKVLAE